MVEQADKTRIDRSRGSLRTALVEMAKAAKGHRDTVQGLPKPAAPAMFTAADRQGDMADEREETPEEAHARGQAIGVDLAPNAILEALLHHVLATAADPIGLREQLRAEALAHVKGIHDGTGATSPFIEGVRSGAADRIIGFFGPDAPISRQ